MLPLARGVPATCEGFGFCYKISWETKIFPDFSKQKQVGEVEAEKGVR